MFTRHTWISLLDSRTDSILLNFEWSVTVFVDLSMTLGLLFYLFQGQKDAFGGTRYIIFNLMQLLLSSGALTFLLSTATLITFNAYPHSLLFGGLISASGKLYGNSMLAMLNTRRMMMRNTERNDEENIQVELSQMRWASAVSTNATVTTPHVMSHIATEKPHTESENAVCPTTYICSAA
ncbi:hypothetical protein BDW22DRAFT_1359297 [Trametopsis cervina]|nr:hypothetical protein BDW22DRAFT_1359297 [Trametopsis cervina]